MSSEGDSDEVELVATSGERAVLEGFLDYQRRAVRQKVAGVSEEDARRKLVPSLTTLAGLITHLTAVERGWFQRTLAQRPEDQIGAMSRGSDPSWAVDSELTVAEILDEYDRVCAESRETAARYGLDDASPHARLGQVSLRWIYAHMIEETARHAGHADILREQIDGTTGDDFA